MPPALIITGSHRSGTSATARLLATAGVDLGSRLVGPRRSNPYGHFEDAAVLAIHDAAFARCGLDWQVEDESAVRADDEALAAMRNHAGARSRGGLWGFKDPRSSYFLEAWREAADGIRAVLVFRNPEAAALSLVEREARRVRNHHPDEALHRRFWEVPDLALRIWLAANSAILRYARSHLDEVAVISFESLGAGFPLVEMLERRWAVGLQSVATHDAVTPRYAASPGRRLRVSDGAILEKAIALHRRLVELERETTLEVSRAR